MTYLRTLFDRTKSTPTGHNPVGAVVVMLFLVLLLIQVATGMFANDEIVFEGPLADLVSRDMSDTLTSWHHFVAEVLLWTVGVHVVANIAYWLILKQNLIMPMFTGHKLSEDNTILFWRSSFLALVILCVVAAVVGLTIGYR